MATPNDDSAPVLDDSATDVTPTLAVAEDHSETEQPDTLDDRQADLSTAHIVEDDIPEMAQANNSFQDDTTSEQPEEITHSERRGATFEPLDMSAEETLASIRDLVLMGSATREYRDDDGRRWKDGHSRISVPHLEHYVKDRMANPAHNSPLIPDFMELPIKVQSLRALLATLVAAATSKSIFKFANHRFGIYCEPCDVEGIDSEP